MFRPAARPLLQSLPTRCIRDPGPGRFLSTAPPSQKSRSWKSSAARWALALGGVYYYNASSVFAETPTHSKAKPPQPEDDSSLPTLEGMTAERRKRSQVSTQPEDTTSSTSTALSIAQQVPPSTNAEPPRTPQEYEDEADQEGAFNPETGEINWDCPCLGGMAHGPCGEQFKAAFSCFVHSKEEPKGMDCIDKFKYVHAETAVGEGWTVNMGKGSLILLNRGMQDCFREHPDVYGSELEDDEEEHDAGSSTNATNAASSPSSTSTAPQSPDLEANPSGNDEAAKTARAKAASRQVHEQHKPESETEDLVPKTLHDDTTSGADEK